MSSIRPTTRRRGGRCSARMQERWQPLRQPALPRRSGQATAVAGTHPPPGGDHRFMQPLTGFRARAVSGYSVVRFFDCLRRREFPTTITIRDGASLEYLPEPDIFHDVGGHVPMHTDAAFAEALVLFGDLRGGRGPARLRIVDDPEKLRRLTRHVRAMSRFFWFSVEFGLMKRAARRSGAEGLRQRPALFFRRDRPRDRCSRVQRYPFQIERAVYQAFRSTTIGRCCSSSTRSTTCRAGHGAGALTAEGSSTIRPRRARDQRDRPRQLPAR